METSSGPRDLEILGLRQQANYWRAQHERAVEREAFWKEKAEALEQRFRLSEEKLAEQAKQMEALKAKIVDLQQRVFGQKSERGAVPSEPERPLEGEPGTEADLDETTKRKRGQQPGAEGHGRRRREELPAEIVIHDVPAAQRRCPNCGKPCIEFPDTEDSEEIEWEVRLFRRIHRRKRYRPSCDCRALPAIVTAPSPAKLIPKGMFSSGFWVRLLLDKFLFQRPVHRIRQVLALEGLFVSAGTLTGGSKQLGELLQPIYEAILDRSRQASHWHMDETRWMVFMEQAGKTGFRWWLWVVITEDTCAFLLDPSRSARVPQGHLGEGAEGIVNADRYAAYKKIGEGIKVSFCWAHVRRDFLKIRQGFRKLRPWAKSWVQEINGLFRLNAARLRAPRDGAEFAPADRRLRDAHAAMAARRDRELSDPDLQPEQRKALESLRKHWDGLSIFLDRPDVPMDNNESERALRNPVVGRKNYYGSGSVWSGMLAVALFTLFQTLLKNGLDPKKVLLAYFEACAQNGGKVPEHPERFLPWNCREEQRDEWRMPVAPT
jgi:transposase